MGFFDFLRGDARPGGGLFGFLSQVDSYGNPINLSQNAIRLAAAEVTHNKEAAKNVFSNPTTTLKTFQDMVTRPTVQVGQSASEALHLTPPAVFRPGQNPISKTLFGDQPIQSIQGEYGANRASGVGTLPALALGALTAAGDIPAFGAGKSLSKLAKATTTAEVKKILPALDDAAAQAVARTKDPNVVKNILNRRLPSPTTSPAPTATSVDGIIPPAGQGTFKERGFISNVAESPLSKPQVAQGIQDVSYQSKYYKTAPNPQTLEKASNYVAKNPIGATEEIFSDTKKPLKDIQAQAMILMGRAQASGTDEGYQQAIRIAEQVAKRATEGGQGSQILATWGRLTPEGMLRYAQKEINATNETQGMVAKMLGREKIALDPETVRVITNNMGKAAALPEGPEKTQLVRQSMEAIASKIPPGASEIFDAYRYQNLLSNPRTHLRNLLGNLTQTFITRPATIGVHSGVDWVKAGLFGKEREAYIKDVPIYYKNLFNNFSDGVEAAKGAWAGNIEQPDLMSLQAFRNKNVPKALTVIPRAMEASDKFLQNLIINAEYAVQKSHGVADGLAREKATETAKYALFRNMTDPKNVTGQGKLLSTIDRGTDAVTDLGRKFKPLRWFVPFIRTPLNISKQFIELSPAGFATLYGAKGVRREEQLAKAIIGTTVMGVGAKEALDGNITWSPPADEKQRDIFYGEGKKPYSIRIGDKWVPLISFGPFAYALGLAGAVKNANDTSPVNASGMEKLTKALTGQAKFFSQQSYVQGLSNFVELLSGTSDTGIAGNLGFSASQAIPLSSLQRYVAGVVDPIYRTSKGFTDVIKAGTPGLSKGLEAKTDIFTGEPARRNTSDYIAPYSLGQPSGTQEDRLIKQSVGDFYRAAGRVTPLKSKVSVKINEAVANKDAKTAVQLANDYNQTLAKALADWANKYPQFASSAYFNQLYRDAQINPDLSQRYRNQQTEQGGLLK